MPVFLFNVVERLDHAAHVDASGQGEGSNYSLWDVNAELIDKRENIEFVNELALVG